MIKIEIPKEGQEEKQMMELVEFMLQHGQIIYYPVIFLQGWFEKKIKVFTKREDGKITGLHVVYLFTCPITSSIKFITGYKAGEDISQQVNDTLELIDGED